MAGGAVAAVAPIARQPLAAAGRPVIEVEKLTKTYQAGEVTVEALRGVSFSIDHGELVAVMGPSGGGKSTLMNLLGCLDRPTSGRYLLGGDEVAGFDQARLARVRLERIGFIFQGFNLLPRTSAIDNVELPLVYAKVPHAERRERALAALASVGLARRAHHHPTQLSGGEQQRVAVARALVNDPQVVLADEPTGNLDTVSTEEVLGVLRRLNDAGTTIVLVTHEPDVAAHGTRLLRLRDGQIESDELNTARASVKGVS
jgi:putative ABC transport system ATP-binding protein